MPQNTGTSLPSLSASSVPFTLFFRNEQLSDLIGFEYANWHGRDAARHFMSEIDAIHLRDARNLIPVFLDGENAWEYYPYNGWHFFNDLYEDLARNPNIRTVTLSEAAAVQIDRRKRLPHLTAGSWVYGTLSTWIGNPDKNRAWELLCDVKQCADRALNSSHLSETDRDEVLRRLTGCESSDWFWWLGGYNSPQFDTSYLDTHQDLYNYDEFEQPEDLVLAISAAIAAYEGL